MKKGQYRIRLFFSLFLADTNCAPTTASCFGVLTSCSETPVMTQTSVSTDFFQSFQILTQFIVQKVCHDLAGFTILDVLLSVKEPVGDFVLTRVLHDRDDLLNIFLA